ncbi:MAG: FAD-dependent oxidoreductase [Labilibaculum sp.]|nr:FAD-dependent oxidoreductase [Labilibaculum sp.]MBI9060173.1 FAD-dependent oxidoreductase [Labilibaculum sp.]
MKSTKHFSVVIIGAGPAGIGAALKLYKSGIKSIAIIERNDKVGGIPSFYKRKKGGVRTFMRWSRGGYPVFGQDYAAWLGKQILKTDVEVKLESQVLEIDAKGKILTFVNSKEGKVNLSADAIIMACGSREETPAERKWIAGARPVKVFFTKQILNLVDRNNLLPMKKPLIIGSDIIAYAAAAKLKAAGASDSTIVDNRTSPKAPFYERLYFRFWGNPQYRGFDVKSLEITGVKSATGVNLNGTHIDCDGIVICGELIPNSELALIGNLKVNIPSRIPVINKNYQLSESGWFAAGNILGGFHGAEWCYYDGKKVADYVLKYISKS